MPTMIAEASRIRIPVHVHVRGICHGIVAALRQSLIG